MKYDPNTREQVFPIKDGRTIFKTHNGFKFWVESNKGVVTEVTEKYWKNIFKSRQK